MILCVRAFIYIYMYKIILEMVSIYQKLLPRLDSMARQINFSSKMVKLVIGLIIIVLPRKFEWNVLCAAIYIGMKLCGTTNFFKVNCLPKPKLWAMRRPSLMAIVSLATKLNGPVRTAVFSLSLRWKQGSGCHLTRAVMEVLGSDVWILNCEVLILLWKTHNEIRNSKALKVDRDFFFFLESR